MLPLPVLQHHLGASGVQTQPHPTTARAPGVVFLKDSPKPLRRCLGTLSLGGAWVVRQYLQPQCQAVETREIQILVSNPSKMQWPGQAVSANEDSCSEGPLRGLFTDV